MKAAWERYGRAGEHWPQGPIGAITTDPLPLADYTTLLREAEQALPSLPDVARRLRRVGASVHARSGDSYRRGVRTDALLAGDVDEMPLTWSLDTPVISQATVDRLASRVYVRAGGAAAPRVALERLMTGIDAEFGGGSELGIAAVRLAGTPIEGLATWVGDLAAWFVEWEHGRATAAARNQPWTDAQAAEQLAAIQRHVVPREALLGDIDGHVLGATYEATVTFQVMDPDAPVEGDPPARVQEAVPLSALLTAYYTGTPPATSAIATPSAAHRFRLFVDHATPAIGNGAGGLGADAEARVAAHVRRTAIFFIYHGPRSGWFTIESATTINEAVARVDAQAATIATIARRFVAFVRGGLQSGTPPADWPMANG
jgi:hypothetical protein